MNPMMEPQTAAASRGRPRSPSTDASAITAVSRGKAIAASRAHVVRASSSVGDRNS